MKPSKMASMKLEAFLKARGDEYQLKREGLEPESILAVISLGTREVDFDGYEAAPYGGVLICRECDLVKIEAFRESCLVFEGKTYSFTKVHCPDGTRALVELE